MLDDLMKEFEPKEYLQMIKDEIAIELLRWKSYNGGGKMLRTIANIKESELNVKKEAIKDKMLNSEVKSNLVAIQKSGIQLPPFYQISVFDYYTYLNYGK